MKITHTLFIVILLIHWFNGFSALSIVSESFTSSSYWEAAITTFNSIDYQSLNVNIGKEIYDSNNKLWISPNPLSLSYSINYNTIGFKLSLVGVFRNAYDVVRNELLYTGVCDGSSRVCCVPPNDPFTSHNIQYNSSTLYFIHQINFDTLELDIESTVSVNGSTPSSLPFNNTNYYSTIKDITDWSELIQVANTYYIVVPHSSVSTNTFTTPYFIERSLIGDSFNKIGITPSTFLQSDPVIACNSTTGIGATVRTNNIDPYNQFYMAENNNQIASILPKCRLNSSLSNFNITTETKVYLNCDYDNYTTLLVTGFNINTYPIIKSEGIPLIINSGNIPFQDKDTLLSLYIDITNQGPGIGTFKLSVLNCSDQGFNFNQESLAQDVVPIQQGTSSRYFVTIISLSFFTNTQSCFVRLSQGLQVYQDVNILFTTTDSTYIPPPQYKMASGTCDSKNNLLITRVDSYCVPNPKCIGDTVLYGPLNICKPKTQVFTNYKFFNPLNSYYSTIPQCDGYYDPSTNECFESSGGPQSSSQVVCETNLNSANASRCINHDISYNETIIHPGSSSKVVTLAGKIFIAVLVLLGVIVLVILGVCIRKCFYRKNNLDKLLFKQQKEQFKQSSKLQQFNDHNYNYDNVYNNNYNNYNQNNNNNYNNNNYINNYNQNNSGNINYRNQKPPTQLRSQQINNRQPHPSQRQPRQNNTNSYRPNNMDLHVPRSNTPKTISNGFFG